MRHEQDRASEPGREPEPALHLRRVLMPRDAVRADRLLGRGEQRRTRSPRVPAPDSPVLPSTRIGPGSTRPARQQRREAEDHRRRVAARVRDELRAGDPVGEQLGQPVHRLLEPGRRRVLQPVPLRVRVGGEPEVPREVDDPQRRPRAAGRDRGRSRRAAAARSTRSAAGDRRRRPPARATSDPAGERREVRVRPRRGSSRPSPCAPRNVTSNGGWAASSRTSSPPGVPGGPQHGDADRRLPRPSWRMIMQTMGRTVTLRTWGTLRAMGALRATETAIAGLYVLDLESARTPIDPGPPSARSSGPSPCRPSASRRSRPSNGTWRSRAPARSAASTPSRGRSSIHVGATARRSRRSRTSAATPPRRPGLDRRARPLARARSCRRALGNAVSSARRPHRLRVPRQRAPGGPGVHYPAVAMGRPRSRPSTGRSPTTGSRSRRRTRANPTAPRALGDRRRR